MEQAREAHLKSLALREQMVAAAPDREDYQRDISVSFDRLGDLYSDLGQMEEAREAYVRSLDIAERLAARRQICRISSATLPFPTVSWDISTVSSGTWNRRIRHLRSLAIAKRLASLAPDRLEYQRDLSILQQHRQPL